MGKCVLEKQHLNSSSTLIKITYRYLCCVSANALFILLPKTGMACAVLLEEEGRITAQTADPQLARGISHPMECPVHKPGEQSLLGDSDIGHHSPFLLFSSVSLPFTTIIIIFYFVPIMKLLLSSQSSSPPWEERLNLNRQKEIFVFSFVIFRQVIWTVHAIPGRIFSHQPREEPRNPLRLPIKLSAVYQYIYIFRDKYPPGEQGVLVTQHGKRSSIPFSNIRHCLLFTFVQNNLQRADTRRWGKW